MMASSGELIQLTEVIEKREQELSSFIEFCRRISTCEAIASIVQETMEYLHQFVEVECCTFYRWLPDQDLLKVVAVSSTLPSAMVLEVGESVPIDSHPFAQETLKLREPLPFNLEKSENLPRRFANVMEHGSCSLLLVPADAGGNHQDLVELILANGDKSLDPEDLAFISAILFQAAGAVGAAARFEQATDDKRFLHGLSRAALRFSQAETMQSLSAQICSEALSLFGVSGAYIWQKQGEELFGIAACGFQEDSFAGSYAQMSEPIFASEIARQGKADYSNNYGLQRPDTLHHLPGETIQSIMGAPLAVSGEIEGVLVFADTASSEKFDPIAKERAEFFAGLAASAIQRTKERRALQEQTGKLESAVSEKTRELVLEKSRAMYLFQLSTELSETPDLDRVMKRVLELVQEVVQADQGAILLVDAQSGHLSYPGAYASQEIFPLPSTIEGTGVHFRLAERVIQERSPIIIRSSSGDEEQLRQFQKLEQKSAIAVPIFVRDEVAGALLLFHMSPDGLSDDSLFLVEAAAFQVGMALSNNRLLNLIRDQAGKLGELLRDLSVTAAQNQSFLESIADGVLVVNATGHVTLANSAARELLGLTKEQLLNKRAVRQPSLIALFGDKWIESAREWALGSQARHKRAYIAQTLKLEDKYVSVHLSPVFADEQFFGTVAVFRDVTHAVETDKAKNEFVSTVSHELRTPMTSIKGYTDLMLMGVAGRMTDEQQQYLSVIKSNADRVTGLVNDLLDVARMESGKIELDLQEINIGDLITVAANDHLRGLIEGGDKIISVRVDIPESLPLVIADPERLMQVLTNLLDNAYNYTLSSGVISIDAEQVGDWIQVAVSDTGIGIKEEHLSSIFERFYRVDDGKVHSVIGTGLGLFIVRSLVLLHGGTIEVQSEVGKGSSFICKLPAAVMSESANDIAGKDRAN